MEEQREERSKAELNSAEEIQVSSFRLTSNQ